MVSCLHLVSFQMIRKMSKNMRLGLLTRRLLLLSKHMIWYILITFITIVCGKSMQCRCYLKELCFGMWCEIILLLENEMKGWVCFIFQVDAHIQQLDQYLRKLEEQRRGIFLLSSESVTYSHTHTRIYVSCSCDMGMLHTPVYVLCRGCKDSGAKRVGKRVNMLFGISMGENIMS